MDKKNKREIKRAKYQKQANKAQAKADRLAAQRKRTNSMENFIMGVAVIGIVALAVTAAFVGSTSEDNN